MRNPRARPGGVWGESRERNVHLKLHSCSFSNFITIISSRSVCQMLANFVVWQQCITEVQGGFFVMVVNKVRCVVGWQTKVWGKNPPRSTGFFITNSASSNNWLVSGHSTDCTLPSYFSSIEKLLNWMQTCAQSSQSLLSLFKCFPSDMPRENREPVNSITILRYYIISGIFTAV